MTHVHSSLTGGTWRESHVCLVLKIITVLHLHIQLFMHGRNRCYQSSSPRTTLISNRIVSSATQLRIKIPQTFLMLPLISRRTLGINLLGQAYELMKQSGPDRLWDQETPGAELNSHVSSIELIITSFSGNIHHGNTANKPLEPEALSKSD